MTRILDTIVVLVIVFGATPIVQRFLMDEGDSREKVRSWIFQGLERDSFRPLLGTLAGALALSYGFTLPFGQSGPFVDLASAERVGFATPLGTVGWWVGFFAGGTLGAKLAATHLDGKKLSWNETMAYTFSGLRLVFAVLIVIAVVREALR